VVFQLPAVVSLVSVGVAVASTGGAKSPLWLALVVVIAYCGYFYPPWLAALYIAGAAAVSAAPLLYDDRAVGLGMVGQLLIAVPAFAAVGVVIVLGKRQLIALRDAAEELALADPLTGVGNRRALMAHLAGCLTGRSSSDRLALMIIDLDDFKDANTLYGYPGGDAALTAVAQALTSSMREGDCVARLGGDEFAMVISGLGDRGLDRMAGRVLAAVREAGETLDLPGFQLSASVGWARYPSDAETVDELVAVADLSLRGAKARGKDTSLSPMHWQPGPART
jgi:diguanylate cyclase (GGDEF)-like protein